MNGNTISDVATLLRLIRNYIRRVEQVTDLIQTMRREGRETLTDAEKQSLRGDDDVARQDLVDAIEDAQT